MSIAVYQTKKAPEVTAGWVRALLEPAGKAMGISNPPPVELRHTRFAGYCTGGEPDRRVVLNSTLHHRSKVSLVSVFAHEAVHRLLEQAGATDFSHDARFFALQSYLFARMDAVFFMKSERAEGALWSHLSDLYDIQDAPVGYENQPKSTWLGASIDWADDVVSKLLKLKLNLSAEDAAKFICAEHPKFLQSLRAGAVELESLKTQLRAEKLANADWRRVNLQTMFFGLLGWGGLVSCVGVKLCWN